MASFQVVCAQYDTLIPHRVAVLVVHFSVVAEDRSIVADLSVIEVESEYRVKVLHLRLQVEILNQLRLRDLLSLRYVLRRRGSFPPLYLPPGGKAALCAGYPATQSTEENTNAAARESTVLCDTMSCHPQHLGLSHTRPVSGSVPRGCKIPVTPA